MVGQDARGGAGRNGAPAAARLDRVRELVMAYGWHSTCYQILNPGFEHWLAEHCPGVVGYVRERGYWVAAGAPVCPPDCVAEVTREFERAVARAGCRACYLGAQDRLRDVCDRLGGHSTVAVGAQPAWDPRAWGALVNAKRSIRSQLHRARNKGVQISAKDPHAARANAEIRACLREWLAIKGLPPMHFMVEPDVLDGVIDDRLVWVAEHRGRLVGFAIASPVPGRAGYLVEEIARTPAAPNGTAELLIDAAMRDTADRGSRYVTLGLVALTRNASPWASRNPWWLRAATAWARAHGRRFYNFGGLEFFREKLHPPVWEPVYAIANRRPFPPSAMWAIAEAFCSGSPVRAFASALGKAARQELAWSRKAVASRIGR